MLSCASSEKVTITIMLIYFCKQITCYIMSVDKFDTQALTDPAYRFLLFSFPMQVI